MRRLSISLAATILLSPALALACGACADRALLRSSWWTGAVGPAVQILLLTTLVLAVFESSARPLVRGAVALIPAVGWAMLLGLSARWFLLTLAAVLPLTLVWSAIVAKRRPRWTRAAAAMGLVCAPLSLLAREPSRETTADIIRDYQHTMELTIPSNSPNWSLHPLTWTERELLRRSDARAAVDSRLNDLNAEPELDTREAALLRLRYLLSGRDAQLEQRCVTWRERQPPTVPVAPEPLLAMCSELAASHP